MIKSARPGTRILVARIFVAALLLLALLSITFPLASLASAPACTLACCAGLPSHAAGSCMGGSCLAGVLPHEKSDETSEETRPIAAIPTAGDDELCGLSNAVSRAAIVPTVYADAEIESNNPGPYVSIPALTKPCQPDCGACLSSTNNRNRQRESFAARSLGSFTPPRHVEFKQLEHTDTKLLEPQRHRGTPRGPPNAFS